VHDIEETIPPLVRILDALLCVRHGALFARVVEEALDSSAKCRNYVVSRNSTGQIDRKLVGTTFFCGWWLDRIPAKKVHSRPEATPSTARTLPIPNSALIEEQGGVIVAITTDPISTWTN
jgi:hypothetical protein